MARMAALLVATGVLLAHGLSQALPGITGPSTPASSATPTPAPRPGLSVSLSGRLDATGALIEDVEVVSEDGLAILKLLRGTRVLDAQGQFPAAITVTATGLPRRVDAAWVGEAYEFRPEQVTLDPPAPLSISYDPRASWPFRYQDVDIRQVYMTYHDEKGPLRPALASVEHPTPSVAANVGHLGTFILFCEVNSWPPVS